ncbi:hypothetical protein AX17_004395 [Amanita inopinata Kibby_2008]|nr:hypothetical protein AX17_004395 [Amanita inopinata Kibby_2008]
MEAGNERAQDIAVFWDYENCHAQASVTGYDIVEEIRNVAHSYGSIKVFKAYLDLSEQSIISTARHNFRSELQSSGVSLIDCPHNGRKDVADKMILVDMLAYAIDNPAPSTIVLITGDRDFAYAIAFLRLRRYELILISPANTHISLKRHASICIDWASLIDNSSNNSPDLLCHTPRPSPSKGSDLSHTFQPVRGNAKSIGDDGLDATIPKNLNEGKNNEQSSAISDWLDATSQQAPERESGRTLAVSPRKTTISTMSQMTSLVQADCQNLQHRPPMDSFGTSTTLNSDITLCYPGRTFSREQTVLSIAGTPTKPMSSQVIANAHSSRTSSSVVSAASPLHNQSETIGTSANAELVSPANTAFVKPSAEERSTIKLSPVALPLEANTMSPEARFATVARHKSVASDHLKQSNLSAAVELPASPSISNRAIVPTTDNEMVKGAEGIRLNHQSKEVPAVFRVLVETLERYHLRGTSRPLRSYIAMELSSKDGSLYMRAGVPRFGQYAALAEEAGIVELGGVGGHAWIGLRPGWFGPPT